MSFTDQKPRVATEQHVGNWGDRREGGRRFRCYLCGYKFKVGDYWRWVSGTNICRQNFLVCERCDGENVLEKWKKAQDELQTRFWWAF